MSTSLETVRKAIEFKTPDYIPMYDSTAIPETDVAGIGFTWRMLNRTEKTYDTEWGFTIRPNPNPGVEGYHVDRNPLASWDAYADYPFPDVNLATAEIEQIHRKMLQDNPSQFRNRYILGHMTAGPYLIVGMLRNEASFFMDLLQEKEKVYELFGRVMDYQIEIFRCFARLGAHGVLIHEDWGSAHGMIMSPASWREIFLPHYLRAKKATEQMGVHFGIQPTGDVAEIIPDLVERKAVDMLFYPEPQAIGIDRLAALVKGRLGVFTCADWKTTGPLGTPADVRAEVRELVRALWTKEGGLAFWLYTMQQFKRENRLAQLDEYRKIRHGLQVAHKGG